MLNEIMHINDEEEARRILMKLGNGLAQVDAYIAEWKKAKATHAAKAKVEPVVVQKVVTASAVESKVEAPKQTKFPFLKK